MGSGIFNINEWTIRGFQIRPINIRFEIFINSEIIKKDIENLQICLNNLLNIMSKSSVNKRYFSRKFVLDIIWNKSLSASIATQLENEKNSQNTKLQKLHNYLTLAYINPAKETSNGLSFNFEINTSIEKDPSGSSNRFNEKLEVYFVFNSSFKIKLSDELLYNTVSLVDLKEPFPITYADNDTFSFRTALFAALKTGKFNGINSGDVSVLKENGERLDSAYISSNETITIKLAPSSGNYRFKDTKILRIQRGSKLATRFHIL